MSKNKLTDYEVYFRKFLTEAITRDTGPFSISNGGEKRVFLVTSVGAGKMIFCEYRDHNTIRGDSQKHSLSAVVVDGIVYLAEGWELNAVTTTAEHEEAVEWFSDYYDKVSQEIVAELKKQYESIEPAAISDSDKERVKKSLRAYLLSSTSKFYNGQLCDNPAGISSYTPDPPSIYDVASILCGASTVGETITRLQEEQRDAAAAYMARCAYRNELIPEHEGIDDWEIAMAHALRDLPDRSNVIFATFQLNQKTLTLKANGRRLMELLLSRRNKIDDNLFRYTNVPLYKSASEIEAFLEGTELDHLQLSHIVKIAIPGRKPKTIYRKHPDKENC